MIFGMQGQLEYVAEQDCFISEVVMQTVTELSLSTDPGFDPGTVSTGTISNPELVAATSGANLQLSTLAFQLLKGQSVFGAADANGGIWFVLQFPSLAPF
jgi:hypothetical protein